MLSFRQTTPKEQTLSYSSFRRVRNTKQTLLIKMLSSRNEREEKKRDVEERQMRVYLKCFCGGGGAFLSFYCAALN